MSWVKVEMSWVKVDGAGWRWVHDLVISVKSLIEQLTYIFQNILLGNLFFVNGEDKKVNLTFRVNF